MSLIKIKFSLGVCILLLISFNAKSDQKAFELLKDRFPVAIDNIYKGRYAIAERDYYMALINNDNDVLAMYGLADSSYKQNNLVEARRWLDKILVIDTMHEYARMLRGQLHLLEGQWQSALEDFLIVVNVNNTRKDVYIDLEVVYTNLGDSEMAKESLEMFNKLNTTEK